MDLDTVEINIPYLSLHNQVMNSEPIRTSIIVAEESVRKISNWYLKSVYPLRRGVTLVIEGILLPQNQFWRCGPILTVTDKINILTMNNSHYRLEGDMDKEKSIQNGFSCIYSNYIRGGFPENWRYVLRNRILGRSSEESTLYEKEVDNFKKHKDEEQECMLIKDQDEHSNPPPSTTDQLTQVDEQDLLVIPLPITQQPVLSSSPPQSSFNNAFDFHTSDVIDSAINQSNIPAFTSSTEQPFNYSFQDTSTIYQSNLNSFQQFDTFVNTLNHNSNISQQDDLFHSNFLLNDQSTDEQHDNNRFEHDLNVLFSETMKPKRRPGRPKGSRNKPKSDESEYKRPRGRPKGSRRLKHINEFDDLTNNYPFPVLDLSSSMMQGNTIDKSNHYDLHQHNVFPSKSLTKKLQLKKGTKRNSKTSLKTEPLNVVTDMSNIKPLLVDGAMTDSNQLIEDVNTNSSFNKLAKRGTIKRRGQMRQLLEEHQSERASENKTKNGKPLFEENSSRFHFNAYFNVQDPTVSVNPKNNSLDLTSFSFNEDTQFEALGTKELDRMIVDEQKVTKPIVKRRSANGSGGAVKRSINIVDDNERSKVKAVMTSDGRTSVEVCVKNDDYLPISEEVIYSDEEI